MTAKNKTRIMSQLTLIIKTEFLTDVRSKAFWIGTIVVPVILIVFSLGMGVLMANSDSMMNVAEKIDKVVDTSPDPETMTAAKAAGMVITMILMFMFLICGSTIFGKVKTEKTNRIMEILSTCVDGKTMILAKMIVVGLTTLLQFLIWSSFTIIGGVILFMIFPDELSLSFLLNPKVILALIYALLYFIGGFLLFGSLYAACGAITDKDNENQSYMTALSFVLMASFYLGQFAVDNGDSTLAVICTYIPLTAPIVGCVNAIGGIAPWWQTILSLIVLYTVDYFSIAIAGKLYRSSLLFRGKQFSPKDIITFLRTN